MTLVKICGIRESEHALAAANAGASLIGFVFVQVRREVKPEVAWDIISTVRDRIAVPPAAIGLFVNESPETINSVVERAGLDLVQLHGDEPPRLAAELDVPAIKALRLETGASLDEVCSTIEQYLETCAGVLIDSHVPGKWGGTGVTGDWELASQLASKYPLILAGGLDPGNVQAAIDTVDPAAVDVSSGVEINGQKDSTKIEAFVTTALEASGAVSCQPSAIPLIRLIDGIRERRTTDIATGIN